MIFLWKKDTSAEVTFSPPVQLPCPCSVESGRRGCSSHISPSPLPWQCPGAVPISFSPWPVTTALGSSFPLVAALQAGTGAVQALHPARAELWKSGARAASAVGPFELALSCAHFLSPYWGKPGCFVTAH